MLKTLRIIAEHHSSWWNPCQNGQLSDKLLKNGSTSGDFRTRRRNRKPPNEKEQLRPSHPLLVGG
jgi:hypothetical protein